MRDDENQQLTVRRLPDGDPYAAVFHSLKGRMLRIDFPQEPSETEVKTGDLVEVTSLQNLYLGAVSARQAGTAFVSVEHRLDRAVLAQIRQVWQEPSGS